MNKKRASQFRKSRGNELRALAEDLFRTGFIRSPDPLYEAANMCAHANVLGHLGWGYELHGLEFPLSHAHLGNIGVSVPRDLQRINVTLHVALRGYCRDEDSREDPFESLSFEVLIEGTTTLGNRHTSAWHLDRHLDPRSDTPGSFVHPLYHFHYGGRRLEGIDSGDHLLLESPRLPHPPLDAILGVDFVIANFFCDAWQDLRYSSSRYVELLRSAQQRCWQPYAAMLQLPWNPIAPESLALVWPQVIRRSAA